MTNVQDSVVVVVVEDISAAAVGEFVVDLSFLEYIVAVASYAVCVIVAGTADVVVAEVVARVFSFLLLCETVFLEDPSSDIVEIVFPIHADDVNKCLVVVFVVVVVVVVVYVAGSFVLFLLSPVVVHF